LPPTPPPPPPPVAPPAVSHDNATSLLMKAMLTGMKLSQ
jgi:hypothetical protein